MARPIIFPVLGLMGVILYGTTRATRPPSLDDGPPVEAVAPDDGWSEDREDRAPPPAPPPAPRLKSDVEAEEARAALLEATARRRRAQGLDSTGAAPPPAATATAPPPASPPPAATPAPEPPGYVPAPITPAQ